MRLCHFSDSHLGAGESYPIRGDNGLTLRQQDLMNAFQMAVDRIIALKPDLCIHAGDLFHAVRPANRIMAIVGEQLSRLAQEAGIPTVIITGNHDAPRQTHVSAALDVYRPIPNLYIVTDPRGETIDLGDAHIVALPHSFSAADTRRQLELCVPSPDHRFNLLVVHGVAAGMPQFAMAELGEQEVSLEVAEGFDYVAFGHYHNFYEIAPRVFYAGSTERLSQAERTAEKGFIEATLSPFKVTFHSIPVRGMIDIADLDARQLRGDELIAELEHRLITHDAFDKIVRVTITGITEETLRTIPQPALADLRRRVFSLDIRYIRIAPTVPLPHFGRQAIGRLDDAFVDFLSTADIAGFEPDRLKHAGIEYLHAED